MTLYFYAMTLQKKGKEYIEVELFYINKWQGGKEE